VSREDNFFELGGDSLLAMRVIVRVQQVFGIDLPVNVLFAKATVAELSATVDTSRAARRGATVPVTPVPGGGPRPLSLYQERVWRHCRDAADGRRFMTMMSFRLKGPLDVPALERSLSELARRHEVLRTTFEVMDGEPVAVVRPPEAVRVPVVEVSGRDSTRAEMVRAAAAEAGRCFDPAREPPLRVTLLRRREDYHWLVLAVHHLVYDATVREVFFDELGVLYAAFRRGERSPLADLPLHYSDFAVWQRRVLAGGPVYREQFAYWEQKLAGHPPPPEWSFRARGPGRLEDAMHRLPPLSREQLTRLKELARREGATAFMLLLAAFKVVLARHGGRDDVSVGSYVVNRNQPEMDGVIGLRTNLVVLRTDLSGDPTFLEALRRVRETTLEAYAHQDIPFEELCEGLRRAGHTPPPVGVIFQYVQASAAPLRLDGLRVGRYVRSQKTMPWGLSVTTLDRNAQLAGGVGADTNLYDPAGVREVIHQFRSLLDDLLADPARRVSDLLSGALGLSLSARTAA
jgi:hypothetical protein